MTYDHATIISSQDYARLQGLMCTMIGSRSPLAALLRRKLSTAAVTPTEDLNTEIVTSVSRVRFRIDGGQDDEHTLSWHLPKRGENAHLSLQTLRGLALLGLSAGQSMSYRTASGRTETIEVGEVLTATRRVLKRQPANLAQMMSSLPLAERELPLETQ